MFNVNLYFDIWEKVLPKIFMMKNLVQKLHHQLLEVEAEAIQKLPLPHLCCKFWLVDFRVWCFVDL